MELGIVGIVEQIVAAHTVMALAVAVLLLAVVRLFLSALRCAARY